MINHMTQLLGRVEYSNLLQINWNEQKLQTNFRLIVEAIQGYQSGQKSLRSEVDWLKEEMGRVRERVDRGGWGKEGMVGSVVVDQEQGGEQKEGKTTAVEVGGRDNANQQISELRKDIQKKIEENNLAFTKSLNTLKDEIAALGNQLRSDGIKKSNNYVTQQFTVNAKVNKAQKEGMEGVAVGKGNEEHTSIIQESKEEADMSQIPTLETQGNQSQLNDNLSKSHQKLNTFDFDFSRLTTGLQDLRVGQKLLSKTDQLTTDKLQQLTQKLHSVIQQHQSDKLRLDTELKTLKTILSNLHNNPHPHPQPQPPSQFSPKRKHPSSIAPTASSSRFSQSDHFRENVQTQMTQLKEMIGETKEELIRVREELQGRVEEVDARLRQEIGRDKEEAERRLQDVGKRVQEQEGRRRAEELGKVRQEIHEGIEGVGKIQKETDRRVEHIHKNLLQLQQQLQRYHKTLLKSSQPQPQSSHPTTTLHSPNPSLSHLSQSLHTLRSQFFSSLRQLQRRLTSSPQQIAAIHQKLLQLKHFLDLKADHQDTRKNIQFIEKKLTTVFSVLKKSEEEDARIGKKNWFCLSCDRVLEGYTGKVGGYVPWERLEERGQGKLGKMGRRRVLPSLEK